MDAQSLAYVYGRETGADADIAHVLTMDVARRIATNIAKLPNYLAASPEVHDLAGEVGAFIQSVTPLWLLLSLGSAPPNPVAMFGSPKILETTLLLLS